MPLARDVDLDQLARRYPLTGSYIRTASMLALARAARRPERERVVTRADLEEAAAAQAARQTEEKAAVGFQPPLAIAPRLSLVAGSVSPQTEHQQRKESP